MEREKYLTKCYTLKKINKTKKKNCGSKETQTWTHNFHIFF